MVGDLVIEFGNELRYFFGIVGTYVQNFTSFLNFADCKWSFLDGEVDKYFKVFYYVQPIFNWVKVWMMYIVGK